MCCGRYACIGAERVALTCRGQAEVVHIQSWRVASPPPAPFERPWYLVQHNRSGRGGRGGRRQNQENVTAGW